MYSLPHCGSERNAQCAILFNNMIKKSSKKAKLITRTSIATFVGVGLLTAAAAAAAFGIASLSMAARRPARAIVIDQGATMPSSNIVIGGTANVAVAAFDFTAGREDILVSRILLQNCRASRDADGDCADAGETLMDYTAVSSFTISYPDSTGATITQTDVPGTSEVPFNGLSFYIPAGTTRTLNVYADPAMIDDVTVFSGMRFQTNLNASMYGDFSASGITSGRAYDANYIGRSFVSQPMILRNTRPTISLYPASPSGAAIPGAESAFEFVVSADAAGDVTFDTVMLKLVASDNDGTEWNSCGELADTSKFSLSRYDNATSTWTQISLAADTHFMDSDGNICPYASPEDLRYVEFVVNELVAAGNNETYRLVVDTTDASALSDDTLSVHYPGYGEVTDLGYQTLDWSDGTRGGTSINERYIDSLTLSGGTLTY